MRQTDISSGGYTCRHSVCWRPICAQKSGGWSWPRAYAGAGVGRLLVEAAEEWALERGFDIMGVRSNTLRLDAHAFYEHLGYRVVKTQKAFRKRLNPKSEI